MDKVWNDAVMFLRSVVKLFCKSTLTNNIVRNSTIATDNSAVLENKLRSLLTYLVKLSFWRLYNVLGLLKSSVNFLTNIERFIYIYIYINLNVFVIYVDVKHFKEFSFLVKLVLTLSHRQASVEIIFSINSTALRQNMKEEFIVAKKVLIDFITSNDSKSDGVPNTKWKSWKSKAQNKLWSKKHKS